MSQDEKKLLRTVIGTLADPRGNWTYGWRLLCELAEEDPEETPPAFARWQFYDAAGGGPKVEGARKSQGDD